MIDGFTNAQIIAALIAVLMASYAAFFGWLVTSIGALRRTCTRLTAKPARTWAAAST